METSATLLKRLHRPLVVFNPSPESHSDDDEPDYHPSPPSSGLDTLVPAPEPIFPKSPVPSLPPHRPFFQPPSDGSSPPPDFTPPPTPGQTHQPFPGPDILEVNHVHTDRYLSSSFPDSQVHAIGMAPHHHYRKPSNDQMSPVYDVASPSESKPQRRIIWVSTDGDSFHKVEIAMARTGEAIRELIFTKLRIADDDQHDFEVFRSEQESAVGDPLSNSQLLEVCRGVDYDGKLNFIVQRSPQSHMRALPLPPPPTTVPPVPPPLRTQMPIGRKHNDARPSPQGTSSSTTSDRRGYEPSLSDDPDVEPYSRRPLPSLRSVPSHNQLPRIPQAQASQPSPQRPLVGISRGPSRQQPIMPSPVGRSGVSIVSPVKYTNGDAIPYNPPPTEPLRIDRGDRRGSVTPTPPNGPPSHGRHPSDTLTHYEKDRERERLNRQRQQHRAKNREETALIREDHTRAWQQGLHKSPKMGPATDGSSSSPHTDTSPTAAAWGPTPEKTSRPGTATGTGSSRARIVVPMDRPNTAHTLSPTNTYQARVPTSTVLGSPGPTGPPTAAPLPRNLHSAMQSHRREYDPPMNSKSSGSIPHTGRVPSDWIVSWNLQDGRAPQRLPMGNSGPRLGGAKSMNDIRGQYQSSGAKGMNDIRVGQRAVFTRPPPLPSLFSKNSGPNNYGGPSDDATGSPTRSYGYGYGKTMRPLAISPSYGSRPHTSRDGFAQQSPANESEQYSPQQRPNTTAGDACYRSPINGQPKFAGSPLTEYSRTPPVLPQIDVTPTRPSSSRTTPHRSPQTERRPGSATRSPVRADDEATLQPERDGWLLREIFDSSHQQLDDATIISDRTMRPNMSIVSPSSQRATLSPPLSPRALPKQPSFSTLSQSGSGVSLPPPAPSADSSDSDSDGGTYATFWAPRNKSPASPKGAKAAAFPPMPPIPSPKAKPKSPRDVKRGSTFVERGSTTWAFRPQPEDMIERLDEFFPGHDLDKDIIDVSPSNGTSPTHVDPPVSPATAVSHAINKSKPRKSIRIVANEHKNSLVRLARRSTKLWGSKVEEVPKRGAQPIPDSPTNVVAVNAPSLKPIFKWVKGDLIGRGTYGRVYLGMNATTGEMLAVKQVELPRSSSEKDKRQLQMVEALKAESETLKELEHPHVVQYLGLEEAKDFMSIFLEYVPGGSIGGCLRKHGKFEREMVKSFTSQILEGLEYLHSRKVLHRDLKADNILLDHSGVCKISDFGISKRVEDMYDDDAAFTSMQGSVYWMAPEVITANKKEGYNSKIDIWSLGCLVLEMWAGRRPWGEADIYAVLFKLAHDREAPPIPEGVELDGVEDDFRKKCFSLNPSDRPTATALRGHPFLLLKSGWIFRGF